MLLPALLSLIAIFLVHRIFSFSKNYLAAKRIGLPIYVTPFSWQDILWVRLAPYFSFIQYLHPWLKARYVHTYLGWSLRDRYASHAKLGGAYTIVTPVGNEILLCDTANIKENMMKHKKWLRPREMYGRFEVFGPNVDTTNGEEWQRHRRVVKAGFNEVVMEEVWNAALDQAKQWIERSINDIGELNLVEIGQACDEIDINVLMATIFDSRYEFVGKCVTQIIPRTETSCFRNTLVSVTQDMFGSRKPTRKDLLATKDALRAHFETAISASSGLMIQDFLKGNEEEKKQGRRYLQTEEMFGDFFIVPVAGFEATSYVLRFSIALLALNPKIQDWAKVEMCEYSTSFAKTVRLQAIMYETLRVYGAAPAMIRKSQQTETMVISGKARVILAMTYVSSNFSAQSHDPLVWGELVGEWKPHRFIETVKGEERIKRDPELMAWSYGPRVCPGKKFSQVEFVAVIGTLIGKYRLESSPGLQTVIDNFQFDMTPKFHKPESAYIQFDRTQASD